MHRLTLFSHGPFEIREHDVALQQALNHRDRRGRGFPDIRANHRLPGQGERDRIRARRLGTGGVTNCSESGDASRCRDKNSRFYKNHLYKSHELPLILAPSAIAWISRRKRLLIDGTRLRTLQTDLIAHPAHCAITGFSNKL